MKKSYKMIDLECANCAAKMEAAIKKLPGVVDVSMSFLLQKLTLETEGEDQSEILSAAVKICKRIEPDCRIDVNSGK